MRQHSFLKRKGRVMQERSVECSGYIVLECECGERLILLGREDDWYSEQSLTFTCGCGEKLTLGHRLTHDSALDESFFR